MPSLAKYTVGEFKTDLRENLGYLIEDAFSQTGQPKSASEVAGQEREKWNLADSLYMNIVCNIQETLDIFKKEILFPRLDLRELALDFSEPIEL